MDRGVSAQGARATCLPWNFVPGVPKSVTHGAHHESWEGVGESVIGMTPNTRLHARLQGRWEELCRAVPVHYRNCCVPPHLPPPHPSHSAQQLPTGTGWGALLSFSQSGSRLWRGRGGFGGAESLAKGSEPLFLTGSECLAQLMVAPPGRQAS